MKGRRAIDSEWIAEAGRVFGGGDLDGRFSDGGGWLEIRGVNAPSPTPQHDDTELDKVIST